MKIKFKSQTTAKEVIAKSWKLSNKEECKNM